MQQIFEHMIAGFAAKRYLTEIAKAAALGAAGVGFGATAMGLNKYGTKPVTGAKLTDPVVGAKPAVVAEAPVAEVKPAVVAKAPVAEQKPLAQQTLDTVKKQAPTKQEVKPVVAKPAEVKSDDHSDLAKMVQGSGPMGGLGKQIGGAQKKYGEQLAAHRKEMGSKIGKTDVAKLDVTPSLGKSVAGSLKKYETDKVAAASSAATKVAHAAKRKSLVAKTQDLEGRAASAAKKTQDLGVMGKLKSLYKSSTSSDNKYNPGSFLKSFHSVN